MEELVTCLVCGAKMKWLQNKHLSKHELTAKEYRKKFPGAKTKSESMTKKLSETRNRSVITKICDREGCNNLCSHNHNKFCSYSCSSKVQMGKDSNPFKHATTNPSFKDGSSSSWKKQRKKRAELDGYTCRRCGKEGLNGKNKRYGVHHIVPRKFFDQTELEERDSMRNTITLCNHCHNEIETLSFYWCIEVIVSNKSISRQELMDYLRERIINKKEGSK